MTVLIWNVTDAQTDRSLQSLVIVQVFLVLAHVLLAVKIILDIIAHITVLSVVQDQDHPQRNDCLVLRSTLYVLCYTYCIDGSDKETRDNQHKAYLSKLYNCNGVSKRQLLLEPIHDNKVKPMIHLRKTALFVIVFLFCKYCCVWLW